MSNTTMVKARKGDLCLVREVSEAWFWHGPNEVHRRWKLYRVHRTNRDGLVQAVMAYGDVSPWPLSQRFFDMSSGIYIASKKHVDVDAALEAYAKEHPEGFNSLEEAREFLRRFLIEASAKEG